MLRDLDPDASRPTDVIVTQDLGLSFGQKSILSHVNMAFRRARSRPSLDLPGRESPPSSEPSTG